MDDQAQDRQETDQEGTGGSDGCDGRLKHPDYTTSRQLWKDYLAGKITYEDLERNLTELMGKEGIEMERYLDIFGGKIE